jgi:hypothetical protein
VRYWVESRWNGSVKEPTPERMRELLDELDVEDDEHPDTWMESESGWMLTVYQDATVVLSSPDYQEHSHMRRVSRGRALQMWILLSSGRVDELRALAWETGRPQRDPAKEAQKHQEQAAVALALDRRFYDQLGPESSTERCSAPGCARDRIELSVFCRKHHFESLQNRPCPFD